MKKHLLIPLAVLVLLTGSATAFAGNTGMLEKLTMNLTDTEKAALEQAHEIRKTSRGEAKQIIADAGISDERMKEIRVAMREAHKGQHEAVKAALEANDFAAFSTAVADSPMADKVDTEAKFAKLVEAHELREAGDHEGARSIMDELGLKKPGHGGKGMGGGRGGDRPMARN